MLLSYSYIVASARHVAVQAFSNSDLTCFIDRRDLVRRPIFNTAGLAGSSLCLLAMAWDGRWSGGLEATHSLRLSHSRIEEFMLRQEQNQEARTSRLAAIARKHREAWGAETTRLYCTPATPRPTRPQSKRLTQDELQRRRQAPTLSTRARCGHDVNLALATAPRAPPLATPPAHRRAPRRESATHRPPPLPPSWAPEEYAAWRSGQQETQRRLSRNERAAVVSRVYSTPKQRREEARAQYQRDPWGALEEESRRVSGGSPPGDEPIFKVCSRSHGQCSNIYKLLECFTHSARTSHRALHELNSALTCSSYSACTSHRMS